MHSNTVSENVIVACESPKSRIINVNIREPGKEMPRWRIVNSFCWVVAFDISLFNI